MKSLVRQFTVVIIVVLSFLISSCADGKDGASLAIESYIQALSDKDSTKISNLSCATWEQSALLEIDSLTSVGSEVANLACEESGQNDKDTYVSCVGSLDLDYNGEAQQIDLSTRIYIARQEDGEWRMCGYR